MDVYLNGRGRHRQIILSPDRSQDVGSNPTASTKFVSQRTPTGRETTLRT
jgi:hypothetical protein